MFFEIESYAPTPGNSEPASSSPKGSSGKSTRWGRIGLAAMPAVSCACMLLVTLVSWCSEPMTNQQWSEVELSTYNPVKEKIVYSRTNREIFRVYRLVVYLVALAAELVAFRRKLDRQQFSRAGVLPMSSDVFTIFQLAWAVTELVLLFATLDSIWVNPGLGMYGWAAAFGDGFPLDIQFTSAVHVILAVISAVGLHGLKQNSAIIADAPLLVRLLFALMLVFAFEYPIYDAKHWYGGSHLANLSGEWMPVYALFRGLLGLRPAPKTETSQKGWVYGRAMDIFIVAMLCLAMLKDVFDFSACEQSWEAPSTYPEEMPGNCSLKIGFNLSKAWKHAVVFGIFFGGSFVLFCACEFQVWRERAQKGLTNFSLRIGSVGFPASSSSSTTTSEEDAIAASVPSSKE